MMVRHMMEWGSSSGGWRAVETWMIARTGESCIEPLLIGEVERRQG